MRNLSVWLPPFAGDYSGACAALFDFNCLIILLDAACCTRNYVEYEEPRWTREKRTAFSAQLRSLEVVLGDDSRILCQARELAEKLNPDFIALLGSPVPALVGMDLQGMAAELEQETGIPALGLDTDGFSFYDSGVSLALRQLIRRFSKNPAGGMRKNNGSAACGESMGSDTIRQAGREGMDLGAIRQMPLQGWLRPAGVNLLGLTPLDFGAKGNAEAIRGALEQRGIHVLFSGAMGTNLDELRNAANASCNLVVSYSGIGAAAEMRRRWDMPYVCAVPFGDMDAFVEEASLALWQGRPAVDAHAEGEGSAILIVSEQVFGISLRAALRRHGCRRPIQVAGFFGMESSIAQGMDADSGEAHLARMIQGGDYRAVIGDPLIGSLPCMEGRAFFPLAHPAVSGSLHWDQVLPLLGAEAEDFLREVASL